MKKALLAGTAIVGATAMATGAAMAAEAPTWKLTGNANFQFYWVDQDAWGSTWVENADSTNDTSWAMFAGPVFIVGQPTWNPTKYMDPQDHDWYFGVDEAELQLNVSGTADNGLNYGFKIEINANTTDGPKGIADEVRLQLSGGWGTLQMGDEDGAEDTMNFGGEDLMGATGGFDGDQDDYLYRATEWAYLAHDTISQATKTVIGVSSLGAPSYPTIAGDTGDATKVTYYSPRFSGFQVGASLTPTPNNGDEFKADGDWENHIGLGANYDNSFGDLRIRASVVYSAASSADQVALGPKGDIEDISAWSVGGIVGWGPFSIGANYTDNAESGQWLTYNDDIGAIVSTGVETSYWNVAASFETGPMYFSAGYFMGTKEFGSSVFGDSTYEHVALTADYTVAPGLGVYAEINMISEELLGGDIPIMGPPPAYNGWSLSNDTTSLVLGMNVSF